METIGSISNIRISNCPIGCKKCKEIYLNKETGFKIVCECFCHKDKK